MSAPAELRAFLIELGINDLHSWRCGHPDLYGPCTCVDEFGEDLWAWITSRFVQSETVNG